MGIKKYYAEKDNTITNAFEPDLVNRGTGSNMGLSDVLEVFSIYGQASSSVEGTKSQELSRVLIQFPVMGSALKTIQGDRSNNKIPASGSVNFYLKMFNAEHNNTLPRGYNLVVMPLAKDWQEGRGLDMESYSDKTFDSEGSNWINASDSATWTKTGGDFLTEREVTQSFDTGDEDLEVDVTEIVEEWIAGTRENYGFMVMLTGSQEAFYSSSTGDNNGNIVHRPDGAKQSYYTKKFFARSSEFFFKRPVIEARYNDSRRDSRGNFILSSSLLTGDENLQTLYFYNYVYGKLRNIPGTSDSNEVYVSIYSGSDSPEGNELELPSDGTYVLSTSNTIITGGLVNELGADQTGIYSCSFACTSALDVLYDVWHNGADKDTSDYVEYFTGSFKPKKLRSYSYNPDFRYVSKITNLKSKYNTGETARLRIFVREKNWSPTIYAKATQEIETTIIPTASYQVSRVVDNLVVIPHGTGSDLETIMSYDVSGNYFDLDMSMLAPGYSYNIALAYFNGALDDYVEQPHKFKFRVE